MLRAHCACLPAAHSSTTDRPAARLEPFEIARDAGRLVNQNGRMREKRGHTASAVILPAHVHDPPSPDRGRKAGRGGGESRAMRDAGFGGFRESPTTIAERARASARAHSNNNNNSINGSRERARARARAMYTYLFTKEITRGRVSAARILILGRKTISRRNTPDHNAPFARLLTLTARR